MLKIGILGGGQLARMLCISAINSNCHVTIYTDNDEFSAKTVCNDYVVGSFNDMDKLSEFSELVDTIIFEFENFDVSSLKKIDSNKFFSKLELLKISQNRITEKDLSKKLNITTPNYITSGQLFYPCILKSTTLGYDGKNQVLLTDESQLYKAEEILKTQWICEEVINFDFEGSVIFFKMNNVIYNYECFLNESVDGILSSSIIIEDSQKYFDYFMPLVKHIDFNGIITIEFFQKGNTIIFNEIAPRVHNSGHITLKSHLYSQFDNLINLVCNYPVNNTRISTDLKMLQVLGQDYDNLKKDFNFYDYQKGESRFNRKMGHIITLKGGE